MVDPTLRPAAREMVDLAGVHSGDRLLDLATGTGVVAREADRRGALGRGLDVAAGIIETASRHPPSSIEFVCGDTGSLPFADKAFDVVTCGVALSHMLDPRGVLAPRPPAVSG